MRAPAVAAEVLRSPETEPGRQPKSNQRVELGDLRFRALMSEADWASLPLAIRRRFSKRLAGGQTIVYAGEILESRMSRAGWWLAQAARLIGGPLPLTRDTQGRSAPNVHVASVVTVTEDMANGGQIWTHGVGMTLTVYAREGALVFRSKNYFLEVFGRRLFVPEWLTPGTLYVTHAELPDGKFSFTLQIFHRRFGLLLRQMAIFREIAP